MELTNGELIKADAQEKLGINVAEANGSVADGNLVKGIIQTGLAKENLSKSVHPSPNSNSDFNYDDPAGDIKPAQKDQQEDGFCEIEMEEEKQDSATEIFSSDDAVERITSTGNHVEKEENDDIIAVSPKVNGYIQVIQPDIHLPKPEAPPGLSPSSTPSPQQNDDVVTRSKSLPNSFTVVDMPSIGKFIKDRSNSLSASISKRFSFFKSDDGDDYNMNHKVNSFDSGVTRFNISGLKVTVKLKKDDEEEQIKGRISFFSRSNCRDCTAVRSFFRERGLKFVEINIDVYRQREKELIERTGNSQVPQIFFNEKLFGGLVALNSLRNSGGFEQRLKEMLAKKCSGNAPAPPVYGFDDHEEESTDEMVWIVKVLRQKLPIQDRLMKMKIVRNCFAGNEMVEVIIHHFDCGRKKAVEIGKQLARKHFIHHVFGENDFEDGNHYYRFIEHEPFIPKCYNFRGSTNDSEPKPAVVVGQRLNKIMSAILESHASDDRCLVDYAGISKSEEFRRYDNLAQDLHRVDVLKLSQDEKLAFFLNLHNAMVIHAVIRVGCPEGAIDRRSFYSDFQYIVGGSPYSLNTIKNGILRSNRRSPYSLVKPFGTGDKRLEVVLPKVNPLIHFGLCNGTRSSPTVRFFTPQGIEAELRCATREFFQRNGIEVDLEKRTVYLTRIIKWFSGDFGQEKEILRWIINYLDATKAGLLTHLLGDGGPVNIVYQDYDWSINA
uniref:Glutaredoxin 48 n=1 Tax=Populus trichocarpa TaxID=3694 RepID=A0A509GJD2_POPTR|nr:glutaredoxin 48 [Populus trichocarpa]